MIDKTKIYRNFIQHSNSCILASYAIAANYFTGIPISDYFRDYCWHFNLSPTDPEIRQFFSSISYHQDPSTLDEFMYEFHFHKEYNNRQISGLNLILEIHNVSMANSFDQSRGKIEIESIPKVPADLQRIENILKSDHSLLISAFNSGRHIAVFGYADLKWFTIETRSCMVVDTKNGQVIRPNKTGYIETNDLKHFGNLGDALLLTEKTINYKHKI